MGVWMPAGHHSFHSELLFAELREEKGGRRKVEVETGRSVHSAGGHAVERPRG